MRSPRTILIGVTKLVAVVVVATAAGAGLGLGLSALNGSSSASAPLATGSAPAVDTTASGAATLPTEVRLVVQRAVLVRATTASAKKRNRARLAVTLQVRNLTSSPVTLRSEVLVVGDMRLARDPRADKAAGSLASTILAGASATGELRFETAGDLTTRLVKRRTVRLEIDGRTITVNIASG